MGTHSTGDSESDLRQIFDPVYFNIRRDIPAISFAVVQIEAYHNGHQHNEKKQHAREHQATFSESVR